MPGRFMLSSVDTTLIDNDSPGIALLLRCNRLPRHSNTLRLKGVRVALDLKVVC